MKLVLNKEFSDLHKRVENRYKKKIKDILDYTQSNSHILPSEIKNYLKKIQKQSFHPLKFYLIEMLDDYLTVAELNSENLESEIFDYWTESEFSQEFMKKVSKSSVLASSEFCLKLFLKHIESFYQIHLLGKKINSKSYRLIKEIGDVEIKKKVQTVGFQEIKSIELSQGPYHYLSFICHDKKNRTKFLKNIGRALEIIKNYSPESYSRFCHFSHTIIPIKEKRVVSYSSQKLPGYSVINLYHRDFIDLLDDLIHENGHHHLNYYLNYTQLIHEDNDKIYYSPWRKSLRPVRGIYHAVFTFYWGMKLFRDLSLKVFEDKINIFKLTDLQKNKIRFRYLEEYLMLEFSFDELLLIEAQGKMTAAGKKVIKDIRNKFNEDKKNSEDTLAYLKKFAPKDYKQIIKLKNHLKKMRAHYKLDFDFA
jgi:hypothetical protein